jgi:hypothetical protein
MKFKRIPRDLGHLIQDNSPAILTGFGVLGVVSTAVLTGKATLRAAEILDVERREISLERTGVDDSPFELGWQDSAKLVWKQYLPPFVVGSLTVGAIIGSNRIGTRRAAAIASAYALSHETFVEYRDKVIEKIGEKKERDIADSVAYDRVHRDLAHTDIDLAANVPGKVLLHDAYTSRFYWSTVEAVNKAVNEVNREINRNDSATISDFFDSVGLSHTSMSDEFGWNSLELLELVWTTVPPPVNGLPAAHSYDFAARPILRPWSAVSFR